MGVYQQLFFLWLTSPILVRQTDVCSIHGRRELTGIRQGERPVAPLFCRRPEWTGVIIPFFK